MNSFYITDSKLLLSFTTDKKVYKPGDEIRIEIKIETKERNEIGNKITDLSVVQGEGVYVNLFWTSAQDNVAVLRYVIYRATFEINDGNRWQAQRLEEWIPPNQLSYTDTTTEVGQTYYYAITSFDTLGNESLISNSPSITVIQQDTKAPVVAELRVEDGKSYINNQTPTITAKITDDMSLVDETSIKWEVGSKLQQRDKYTYY